MRNDEGVALGWFVTAPAGQVRKQRDTKTGALGSVRHEPGAFGSAQARCARFVTSPVGSVRRGRVGFAPRATYSTNTFRLAMFGPLLVLIRRRFSVVACTPSLRTWPLRLNRDVRMLRAGLTVARSMVNFETV